MKESLVMDTGAWHLETGSVRALEDSSDGFVSGFIFEGKGP